MRHRQTRLMSVYHKQRGKRGLPLTSLSPGHLWSLWPLIERLLVKDHHSKSNNTKKNIVIALIKGNAKPPDPIGVCIILVSMETLPREVLLQISGKRLIST